MLDLTLTTPSLNALNLLMSYLRNRVNINFTITPTTNAEDDDDTFTIR